jgi:probable F420-dependent oxidoreductase
VKVGVFVPSFLQAGDPDPGGARLRAFGRRAEELGFDSLWITDHVVTAKRFYSVSWLDSITTLAHVAAITERVSLGTSILILPLRQPALLAKEIATLHHLSGQRYIFGIGTGWFGPEFEACGTRKSERGRRTDEVLEATLALFQGPDVTFSGRHYSLNDVTVEPHPATIPPVWVGGGRQLAHDTSPEHGLMHPNVLKRIVGADGWIARPTCPPEGIALDLADIRAARSPDAPPIKVAHENFTWIEESGTPDEIKDEQQRRFASVMSDERPWEYIDSVYMPGTIDAIQQKIQARIDAGVEYLMLHTLSADISQLEAIARHVVEPFRSA